MDPEQTFLRVHARLSGMLAQLLSPRLRGFLEHFCLVVAILLLVLLAVMHANFVSQAGCANELSHDKVAAAELLQIKMVGQGLWSQKSFSQSLDDIYASEHSESSNGLVLAGKSWLYWLLSGAWKSKGREKLENGSPAIGEYSKGATQGTLQSDAEREAALLQMWDSWTLYGATWLARIGDAARTFAKFWRNTGRDWLFSNTKDGTHAFSRKDHASEHSEKGGDGFEPVYLYSIERGYLLLPEDAKTQHNVQMTNMSMSARNPCFGNRWQQLLINSLVGYDTILMNSLLEARGEGYLYNYQTKELYGLSYPREAKGVPRSFQGYVISKCGVLIMSLFVFFTTTMSVSFTLRETQARMLKFTVQLQYHARNRLPTFRLIFVHVIESLVFVPIMIGILFFLFEFYEDQLLAFMVLTLVWLCELFTMISVRTSVSMQYFPRYFFLYFMVFHIYFFSYEYGFSYLAFSTTAAFMQHLVLYFWNHFEVPALQRFLRAQMQLQRPGFQITSSAIITSTLHVARLAPTGSMGAHETGPNAFEEHTRNISRSFNGPGGVEGQGGGNPNMYPQVWPGGAVDRMWIEHWNGVRRNPSGQENLRRQPGDDTGSGNDTIASASSEFVPEASPERGNEVIGQQSFHASSNTSQATTAWNSFGSILLWILGGPSEHLSSYLPMFRDLNSDNTSNPSPNPTSMHGDNSFESHPHGEEEVLSLRRRARNAMEGDNLTT